MKIGIRSVSAPARSFLSRGGLIGVMLLAVFLLTLQAIVINRTAALKDEWANIQKRES